MPTWVLSAEAQRDLQGIRRYTEQKWGFEQARKYRAQLRDCAARLGEDPRRGKVLTELRPGLRMVRCQHHYIVCRFAAKSQPLIVAILHEKMDLMARIAERLGK